jgi:hypothetical protein
MFLGDCLIMHKVFDLKPRKVKINLDSGIYAFEDTAANGKTYLMSLIKTLNELELLKACNITYKKDLSIENVIEEISQSKYDIIFFDRMDLYVTKELCVAIENVPKETIVLMDIKDLNLLYRIGANIAFINLKENIIEVW